MNNNSTNSAGLEYPKVKMRGQGKIQYGIRSYIGNFYDEEEVLEMENKPSIIVSIIFPRHKVVNKIVKIRNNPYSFPFSSVRLIDTLFFLEPISD